MNWKKWNPQKICGGQDGCPLAMRDQTTQTDHIRLCDYTCQNLRSFQASLVTDITFSWFNSWAVITLSNFLIRCLSFMRLNKTTCPTKKQQKASLLDFDLWKNIRLNNNGPQCSTDKLFWRKLFLERNAICGFDSVVSKMLCLISSHPS